MPVFSAVNHSVIGVSVTFDDTLMRVLLPLGIALKALRGNVMRTLLTLLGVIIGVSAVICTVSIGEGASAKIRAAIVTIGGEPARGQAGRHDRQGVGTG